jgi:hypothetical protein
MASSVDQDEPPDEAEHEGGSHAGDAAFLQDSGQRNGDDATQGLVAAVLDRQSGEALISPAADSIGGTGGDTSAVADFNAEELAMTPAEAASASTSSALNDDNDGHVIVSGLAVTAVDSSWAASPVGEAAVEAGGAHAEQASSPCWIASSHNSALGCVSC